MKKSKFFRCGFFSFYIAEGIRWFRLFKLKLSFRHINNYKFESDDNKGMFLGHWLITLRKK